MTDETLILVDYFIADDWEDTIIDRAYMDFDVFIYDKQVKRSNGLNPRFYTPVSVGVWTYYNGITEEKVVTYSSAN